MATRLQAGPAEKPLLSFTTTGCVMLRASVSTATAGSWIRTGINTPFTIFGERRFMMFPATRREKFRNCCGESIVGGDHLCPNVFRNPFDLVLYSASDFSLLTFSRLNNMHGTDVGLSRIALYPLSNFYPERCV